MTKYVLSSFKPDMIDLKKYRTEGEEISEDEFKDELTDAIAVVSHPAFARILKLPQVRTHIRLHPGDVALVISTEGGKLDYNARELPPHLSLKYDRIEIVEAEA